MNREVVVVILAIAIASPFVFAWAYIRPDEMSPLQVVIAAAAGAIVSVGAYVTARKLVRRAARRSRE